MKTIPNVSPYRTHPLINKQCTLDLEAYFSLLGRLHPFCIYRKSVCHWPHRIQLFICILADVPITHVLGYDSDTEVEEQSKEDSLPSTQYSTASTSAQNESQPFSASELKCKRKPVWKTKCTETTEHMFKGSDVLPDSVMQIETP